MEKKRVDFEDTVNTKKPTEEAKEVYEGKQTIEKIKTETTDGGTERSLGTVRRLHRFSHN